MKRAGFTLIELLVVIVILVTLVGSAMPFVQTYVSDSRLSKAKSDLEEIQRALTIYETREGPYTQPTLHALTGRYLMNSSIDPWGKQYGISLPAGTVWSAGPDRIENTLDDIVVNYQAPLALVQVKWIDANLSGSVDTQNSTDYLQLYFSRKVASNSLVVTDAANAWSYFLWSGAVPLKDAFDWPGLRLATAGQVITLDVAAGLKDVFSPGRDFLQVADGSGIVDVSVVSSKCITGQTVVIMSQ